MQRSRKTHKFIKVNTLDIRQTIHTFSRLWHSNQKERVNIRKLDNGIPEAKQTVSCACFECSCRLSGHYHREPVVVLIAPPKNGPKIYGSR